MSLWEEADKLELCFVRFGSMSLVATGEGERFLNGEKLCSILFCEMVRMELPESRTHI